MIQKLADLPHKPTLMFMLMPMLMFVFVFVFVFVPVFMLSLLVFFSAPRLTLHVAMMPLHLHLGVHVIIDMEPGPTVPEPFPLRRGLTHHSSIGARVLVAGGQDHVVTVRNLTVIRGIDYRL